jgi:hypothetical protein
MKAGVGLGGSRGEPEAQDEGRASSDGGFAKGKVAHIQSPLGQSGDVDARSCCVAAAETKVRETDAIFPDFSAACLFDVGIKKTSRGCREVFSGSGAFIV